MTTTTAISANRGYLKKMALAGRLYLKCRYHYTDDYAYDNAVKCGKGTEFRKAYVQAEFTTPEAEQINALYAAAHPGMPDADAVEKLQEISRKASQVFRNAEEAANVGSIRLYNTDFRSKSGGCYGSKESGSFSIHSNLSYEYEVRNV